MKLLARLNVVAFLMALLGLVTAASASNVVAAGLSDSAKPPQEKVAATSGSSLDLLVEAMGVHKLVLLGEMHGTKETPALMGDLVAHETADGKQVILALEITSLDQALVDRYVASAGKTSDQDTLLAGEHWQDPDHDGRDSQAMLALVERVRELRDGGADVAIDFFDVPGEGERDQRMADHLRDVVQRSPKATVLVLTGNIHAMIAAPSWKMFNAGKQIELPMTAGQHLADLRPFSVNVSAAAGDVWNCRDEGCRVYAMQGNCPISHATMRFAEQAGSPWNAKLTLPSFTASPPAVFTADN